MIRGRLRVVPADNSSDADDVASDVMDSAMTDTATGSKTHPDVQEGLLSEADGDAEARDRAAELSDLGRRVLFGAILTAA